MQRKQKTTERLRGASDDDIRLVPVESDRAYLDELIARLKEFRRNWR